MAGREECGGIVERFQKAGGMTAQRRGGGGRWTRGRAQRVRQGERDDGTARFLWRARGRRVVVGVGGLVDGGLVVIVVGAEMRGRGGAVGGSDVVVPASGRLPRPTPATRRLFKVGLSPLLYIQYKHDPCQRVNRCSADLVLGTDSMLSLVIPQLEPARGPIDSPMLKPGRRRISV